MPSAGQSPILTAFGRAASALVRATDKIPLGGPDAKLSAAFGAVEGCVAGAGHRGLGAFKGAVIGLVNTIVAEKLRRWSPDEVPSLLSRPLGALQRAERLASFQVGPAIMEAVVGATIGAVLGLMKGSGWSRAVNAVKTGVGYFFVWGGIQLAVQNTIDLGDYADARSARAPGRPAARVVCSGERVPAGSNVEGDHKRCLDERMTTEERDLFERTQTEARSKVTSLFERLGLDVLSLNHQFYVVDSLEATLPMKPRTRSELVLGEDGTNFLRMSLNMSKRASRSELLDEMGQGFIRATILLLRGAPAGSSAFERSTIELLAHVALGIDVPLLHRSTRKLLALYRGLPQDERNGMLRALVDSLAMERPRTFREFVEAPGAAHRMRRAILSHFGAENLQAVAQTP